MQMTDFRYQMSQSKSGAVSEKEKTARWKKSRRMKKFPQPSRPHMPGYGVSKKRAGMLEWSRVSKQMAQARNYWIITTRADRRPHAAPVWGIWLDEIFYLSTGARSVKAKNLARNPALVVHLESGDDAVILEGIAERVRDAATLARFNQAYGKKYKFFPLGKGGKKKSLDPIYALHVRVAFNWIEKKFLVSPTRWVFENKKK